MDQYQLLTACILWLLGIGIQCITTEDVSNEQCSVSDNKDDCTVMTDQLHVTQSNDNCNDEVFSVQELFAGHEHMKSLDRFSSPHRLVPELMQHFGTHTYLVLSPSATSKNIYNLLPYMHPDAVVEIVHMAGQISLQTKGLFSTYFHTGRIKEALHDVQTDEYSGPAIIAVHSDNLKQLDDTLNNVLPVMRGQDLLLVNSASRFIENIQKIVCLYRPKWSLYDISGTFVIKYRNLGKNNTLSLPVLPDLSQMEERPYCSGEQTSTDFILMTKNRPMHTQAFLDSLALYITGIAKIWILVRADDTLITEAYTTVIECFRKAQDIDIEMIVDAPGQFRSSISTVLERISSANVVLNVDEMIWVRPVDLAYLSCLLQQGDGTIGSVQLRLGHSYGQSDVNSQRHLRFHTLLFDSDIDVYYPRYMKHDLGYVTNTDGTLMRTRDLRNDLNEIGNIQSPLGLESAWVYSRTHIRTKQWHLMFHESRVVNNMVLGKQVAKSTEATEEDHVLTKRLLFKEKIDVKHFADTYRDQIKGSHSHFDVQFVENTCQLHGRS